MTFPKLACVAAVLVACSSTGGGIEGQPGDETGGTGGDTGSTTVDSGGVGPTDSSTASDSGGGGKDTGGGTTDTGSIGGTSAVTIIVEPNGKDASEIVDAINAAKSSVHMTMYEIDNPTIISALIARKGAGIDVRAVLNQTFPSSSTSNAAVYSQLTGAGIGVTWSNASRFTYTHEKTFIFDNKTAFIMTMNCMKSSPKYNREYIAIDTELSDVQEAEAIFEADFGNTTFSGGGSLVLAPDPPNNARTALVALVDSAKSTVDVEVEEFSDLGYKGTTGLSVAVANAASRGVKVRVIVAQGTGSSNQTTAIGDVKSAGGSVVVSGGTSGSATSSNPYIHAKAILIDCSGTTCAKGFIGSENFSGGSLGYNRELGVFITAASELAKIKTAIDSDFASGTPQ
ncbi:MAG: phosphatidylserine/phosphatidylglycerophosphate/cardiolipin synthase family protein [Polyangiales bacterium]